MPITNTLQYLVNTTFCTKVHNQNFLPHRMEDDIESVTYTVQLYVSAFVPSTSDLFKLICSTTHQYVVMQIECQPAKTALKFLTVENLFVISIYNNNSPTSSKRMKIRLRLRRKKWDSSKSFAIQRFTFYNKIRRTNKCFRAICRV